MIPEDSTKQWIALRARAVVILVIAAVWLSLAQAVIAQQGGAANYFYDANGRLTAVLSPTGEAAIYNYDPAGNFTSITRRDANTVSIIEFTPGSGAVGAQVTIYGTGFSATPGSNTVKFNGVTATVNSATKTQLIVNVPAGATTGAINVTTPNGSTNSANQFYVTAETLYFNTRITVGESVVIPPNPVDQSALVTFDGAANQRISFVIEDLTNALSSGSITYATVYLINPSGTTLATTTVYNHADVPFPGFPGTAVAFGFLEPVALPASGTYSILIDHNGGLVNGMTLRLYDVSPDVAGNVASNGAPFPVSLTSPGQNARPTFNGAAGLRVSLRARQTISTIILSNVAIIKPDGTNLTTATLGSDLFIDPVTLPVNGTYTILVDPQYNKTTPTTLYLYDLPLDATGSLTINGSTVTTVISTPGQNAGLSFNVASTQNVTIRVSSNAIADPLTGIGVSSTISILNSGGTTVYSASFNVSAGDLVVPTALSPGNYTLKIDPTGAGVGSMSLRLTSP